MGIIKRNLFGLLLLSEWCYQSQVTCENHCKGPEKWHEAKNECGLKKQSPINIVTKKTLPDERLTNFRFEKYQDTFSSSLKNNGHSVQVNLEHGPLISNGGLETKYKAMQFHFHWGKNGSAGSEHTVDGEQYPMELHIVHIKEKYSTVSEALGDPTGVAVLGFFYEESSSPNRKYDPIITSLKNIIKNGTSTPISDVSLASLILLEKNMTSYYRYSGSLTTPNCAESVVWTVFKHTIPLGKTQLSTFSTLKFSDGTPMVNTFRPVQPLYQRQVYRSGSCITLASVVLLTASLLVSVRLLLPS
ncbi:hypothetical protein GN956_G1420 [Arapaima gigas]